MADWTLTCERHGCSPPFHVPSCPRSDLEKGMRDIPRSLNKRLQIGLIAGTCVGTVVGSVLPYLFR